jgi:hypothetical protein
MNWIVDRMRCTGWVSSTRYAHYGRRVGMLHTTNRTLKVLLNTHILWDKQKLLRSTINTDILNSITCTNPDEQQNIQELSNEENQQIAPLIDESQVYDWILDIDLITNISTTGWAVILMWCNVLGYDKW